MDPEMNTLYPAGVCVLLVDDDVRFLRAASMLLTLLDFTVSTCYTLSSALRFLTSAKRSKEIDVVLADARKATTCGFNFRGIVERDLRIPVLYFLSERYKCDGEEADALLRTLALASLILKKPLEGERMCLLWRDIAWRHLELKQVRACLGGGGDAGQGSSSGAGMLPSSPWSDDGEEDEEEEERVHFRVVTGVKGRKRKVDLTAGSSSGSGGGGPSAARRGRPAQNQEKAAAAVAGQQETDPVAKPAPRKSRSKKAKATKNTASPSMPVIPETIDVETYQPTQRCFERQPSSQQPKQSRFVQSVLKTLDVPPYNPSIFADAVEPGSNIINFSGPAVDQPAGSNNIVSFSGSAESATGSNIISFSGAGRTAAARARAKSPAVKRARTAPVSQAPQAPAPPRPARQQAPAPTRPARQQAPPPALAPAPAGNVAPAAAATAMSATAVKDKQPSASGSKHQEKDLAVLLRGAFGPFPYQGPPQPAMQQNMFGGAPPCNFAARNNVQLPFQQPPTIAAASGGNPFAGMMAGGGAGIGGGAATATHVAGNYGNYASTPVQPLILGAGPDKDLEEMMAMYATDGAASHQPMVLQQVAPMYYDNNIVNNAAMYYGNGNTTTNNNNAAESFMAASDQVLGMAYGVNNQAMAGGGGGGAFNGNNAAAAAAFLAPQGQGFNAALDQVMNQVGMGDGLAAFDPSVENVDNITFPLEALVGTDMTMFDDDAGVAAGQDGGATGGAAAVDAAAGNYLNGGEGGMENGGVGAADGDGDDIFEDMLMDNLFPNPQYLNNGRE